MDQFQLLETLERRNQNLRRVNDVSQKLTSLIDAEVVMAYLLQASAEIIGAPVASLWLWEDSHRQLLVCRATYPANEVEALRLYRLDPNTGVAGWVVTHQISAVTRNAYADARFASEIDRQTGFNTQSMLAVPLRLRDEVIGVIEILNKFDADFDDEDLAMIETLAAAAAIALDNASLFAQLRRQTEQLQVQNSELDAFAHTVAHDLKGPLATIMGFSDFLLEYELAVSPQDLEKAITAIGRSSHKMHNIIQEILLLSGVRKADIKPQPINMQEVVGEAISRLSVSIHETQAALTGPTQWPVVYGYAPWVEEIWVNYISNALKYGGRPPVVEFGCTEAEDVVWFWVSDNGHGLSAEQQSKLFIPFTRLEQVRVKGHGLGLSIVQRIVSKLGGQVKIESEIGEGSKFLFSLPRQYTPLS